MSTLIFAKSIFILFILKLCWIFAIFSLLNISNDFSFYKLTNEIRNRLKRFSQLFFFILTYRILILYIVALITTFLNTWLIFCFSHISLSVKKSSIHLLPLWFGRQHKEKAKNKTFQQQRKILLTQALQT